MSGAAELVERGMQAFTRGRAQEAEYWWRQALAADPSNERARAYLEQMSVAAPEGGAEGAPRPAAASLEAPAVPLPAPEAPATPHGPEDFAPSPWDQGPQAGATVVLDPDGGLDLSLIAERPEVVALVPDRGRPGAAAAAPKSDVEVWMKGARELFALGDFSGSLEMIEKILRVDPNHPEAREYLRSNEQTLISMYESKLGSLASIPRLAIKPEEVMWLNLDHRAGFLLAQIDGTVNYEDLFALSGLPRLDTARILSNLLTEGVIR